MNNENKTIKERLIAIKTQIKKRLNTIQHKIAVRKSRLINWWSFKKKILQLWWADAPKEQIYLEKGAYYLKRGTVLQVGQPIKFKEGNKFKKKYIRNLVYNFKKNKVEHVLSTLPIKGLSEQFEKRR